MKKLSAYTVASNCTDLTDIRDGIAEIHEAMKTCVESGKHIPFILCFPVGQTGN